LLYSTALGPIGGFQAWTKSSPTRGGRSDWSSRWPRSWSVSVRPVKMQGAGHPHARGKDRGRARGGVSRGCEGAGSDLRDV